MVKFPIFSAARGKISKTVLVPGSLWWCGNGLSMILAAGSSHVPLGEMDNGNNTKFRWDGAMDGWDGMDDQDGMMDIWDGMDGME